MSPEQKHALRLTRKEVLWIFVILLVVIAALCWGFWLFGMNPRNFG